MEPTGARDGKFTDKLVFYRFLPVLFASLLCVLPGRARAQREVFSGADMSGSSDELDGLMALDGNKYVRARELGEKILREHPGAYAGHYILGVALHYGDGDLARSVLHLEEAARLFEARHGTMPREDDDAPWPWHEHTLKELGYSLDEMDRPAEQLVVLDRYDRAYTPKLTAQHVWPLMKLRRFDEARATAKLAMASGYEDQRLIAKTGLCATEYEAGDREASYRACKEALETYPGGSGGGQMEYSNASESAIAVYRFDEGERWLAEAVKRVEPVSWGNPYQPLVILYLGEGRIVEAIEAVKAGQELRLRRPAWLDQYGQARLDWTAAELLLVVGETERATLLAERAAARPDRVGIWSGTAAQEAAGSSLLVAVVRREKAERELEEAACAGWVDGTKLRWRALEDRVAAWRAERRTAMLLASEVTIEGTLRPYYIGGAVVPVWHIPELVRIVGAGVTLGALAVARTHEHFGASPAYLDAVEAEAEYARGHDAAALAAAERALAVLPQAEALLRGRVAAVAAELSRRGGDEARAAVFQSQALALDPGVLRRLGVALPVKVESDGSPIAQAATSLLDGTPRFRIDGRAAHSVSLRAADGSAEACLLGPKHERLQCATVAIRPAEAAARSGLRWGFGLGLAALLVGAGFLLLGRRLAVGLAALALAGAGLVFFATRAPTPVEESARRLVAELQKAGFAFSVDLKQSDLNSLDGSPTAERAERQVKSLLDALGPDEPPRR